MNKKQAEAQLEHMEMVLSRLEREMYKCRGEIALMKSEILGALGDNHGNGKDKAQAYSAQAYQRV